MMKLLEAKKNSQVNEAAMHIHMIKYSHIVYIVCVYTYIYICIYFWTLFHN